MSPMVSRPLSLEYALLGFLLPGPMHGYQIHAQLSAAAGLKPIWRLKQAQLYALLGKLEDAGYVASKLQPQAARPARRVFELSQAGRKAFQRWLSSPVARPRQMRQEFQAKLYFARLQSAEAARRLLELQRQACREWLAEQRRLVEQERRGEGFLLLLEHYRLGQVQAMLDWLDFCETSLSP